MKEPAQKILVNQYLNWNLVGDRLNTYKHIAILYPIKDLKNCIDKEPFFCHYLAWRLGTWKDEQWFEFFDYMLEVCMTIPNWNNNRVPKGCEFGNFWSFIWELQCAVFFANQPNVSVQWTKDGPDLYIIAYDKEFFVECTTYHKSFELELFIEEIMGCISPQIKIAHVPLIKFSLPKNNDINIFISNLFKPYLDPSFIQGKISEAQRKSPLLLPLPEGINNFFIFLEDENSQEYNFDQPWVNAGDPESYIDVALEEVIGNKKNANRLQKHHPNLLAVNFLLGIDWQTATALEQFSMPKLHPPYDGVVITTCGIDSIPVIERFTYSIIENHPFLKILKKI